MAAKKLVLGILAHVDAGKTTLSEAMLYRTGTRRTLGRVDHADAFLDTDVQEKERGITIFSKQALLSIDDLSVTLLDTPGHVDFSAEAERTLSVLDCAILVISGTDGIQGHTRTLWKLLSRYQVPVFIFVNKMDLAGADRDEILNQLHAQLGDCCVAFDLPRSQRDEAIAMCDEEALDQFLNHGTVNDETIIDLIGERKVVPCRFGAALKTDGVDELLSDLALYAPIAKPEIDFGASIYKITYDEKTNTRLTWMRITGGALRAKQILSGGAGENHWEEKVDQIRLYSGAKYRTIETASSGDVVAVTGLSTPRAGEGLGYCSGSPDAVLEPVIHYSVNLPAGIDPVTVLPKLRQLEEEDPMLRITWNEQHRQIQISLMGQVQLEILHRLIRDRFGLEVSFGTGDVVYKETIANCVEGIGHYEPLRHYAEVHLLLEPLPRGSGIEIATNCPTDRLDAHWQNNILSQLRLWPHKGVRIGAPLTDIRLTLLIGAAHLKHTEGGDFRQAACRAVRQGLMKAESVILEPHYQFALDVPKDCVGRALMDLDAMGGVVDPPEQTDSLTHLTGHAPVAGLREYWKDVTAYTKGLGSLICTPCGYEPSRNPDEVEAAFGYDPLSDMDHPADSVFCAHGGGFTVKWNEVEQYMHLHSGWQPPQDDVQEEPEPVKQASRKAYSGSVEEDNELLAIFERTYGKVTRRDPLNRKAPSRTTLDDTFALRLREAASQYLLVDGYNIIFAWDALKEIAEHDISAAREKLEEILINYRGFWKCEVILVFDAYKVKGGVGSIEKKNGIYVVYTKEAQTADNYIEQTTYNLSKNYKVRVATSDSLVQTIILGHNCMRLSADAFYSEILETQERISRMVNDHNLQNRDFSKIANFPGIFILPKRTDNSNKDK